MRTFMRWMGLMAAVTMLVVGGGGCSRQATKEQSLEQGDRHFAAGDYDKAEVEYLSVLHQDAKCFQAIRRLGLIWFEQGRLERALPMLVKSRELQPDNLDVREKLGLAWLAAGKNQEAHDEAVFILGKNPQKESAMILLAESATTEKILRETRQWLDRLPPAALERAVVQVALGDLCFQQRDLKGAEAAFKRAVVLDPKSSAAQAALGALYWSQKNLQAAEPALRTASELAPLRSPRRLQYAQFKIQNGDLPAGKRLLEELVQKVPDYTPAWSLLAEIAFQEKRYDDCGGMIKKILARDSSNYDAMILSGRLKLAKGDAAKAVAEFDKLVTYYPKAAYVRYQLALACMANQEMGKARSNLNDAVNLNPDFAEAVLLLSELKLKSGDISSTIVSLRQFIQRQPQTARAWLLLAEAYRAQNNLEDALAVYRRYEVAFGRTPEVSLQMGVIHFLQGRRDEARKSLENALAQSPDFVPALDQLVALDVVEKNFAAALTRVNQAVEKRPNQPELRFLQAKVYLAQQDSPRAISALLKLVELQPDFSRRSCCWPSFTSNPTSRRRRSRSCRRRWRGIRRTPGRS